MFLVRHIQSWQPQFLHLDIRTQSDLHSCRHGLHKTEMGCLDLPLGSLWEFMVKDGLPSLQRYEALLLVIHIIDWGTDIKWLARFWKLWKAHLCMDKQIILKSSWKIISTIMTFTNNMWNMWSSTCPGHLFNKLPTFQNCHPHPHPIPPGYVLHPIDHSCYHPQHKLHWNPAALPRHDLHRLRPLRVKIQVERVGGPWA